ncbi:gas vesicle protein GvpH [Halomarina halobia]|uniref:Gas vesicle protein GvpH n=1 Tax=Halomarina halobia TaxID=3033386 RepID=A0ABD6AAV3_9EURY|nr:gas vesicle protein GvpH [Halomarina sp. PSR21]
MTDPDSADDGNERTNAETSDGERSNRRGTGFRLEVGLRSITDLLNGLVDVDVSHLDEEGRQHPIGERRERRGVSRRPSSRVDADGSSDADDYHVETYRYDGELVVVADLPGVDEDDLLVGLDERSNDLVIAVRDRVVERLSLPWDPVAVPRVRFNNAVLEVVVRPGDDAETVRD